MGGSVTRGESGSAAVLGDCASSWGKSSHSGGIAGAWGRRVVPPGAGGGGLLHPPWICRVGV